MALPDFQTLLLPVLRHLADGAAESRELRERVARELDLSEADVARPVKGGGGTLFANRVAWALVDLQRAGLVTKIDTGRYRITDAGKALLAEGHERIDRAFLRRLPAYVAYIEGERARAKQSARPAGEIESREEASEGTTPVEQIAALHADVMAALEDELLDRLRRMPPLDFQRLLMRLLAAMGYGGGRAEMGEEIRPGADGGIDGVIREDALGLDIVYLQAKRYAAGSNVGRPEVQAFAGSLDGVGANKGLFFTTSSFTTGAVEYVRRIAKRIVLVDGRDLAQLMVQHNVGVRVSETYEIKTIDENVFLE